MKNSVKIAIVVLLIVFILLMVVGSSFRLLFIGNPYLDFCHRHNFYDELYKYDLRQGPLPFTDNEFDVATCIEVIEHLPKNSGAHLLKELERIAKKVIITAPSGPRPQKALDNNPFQKHLSCWYVEDLTKRGYKVRGFRCFTFAGQQITYLSSFLSKFSYVIPKFSQTLLAYKLCNGKD